MPTDKIARLRELYNKRGRSNLHRMEYSEAVENTYIHLLAIAEKAKKLPVALWEELHTRGMEYSAKRVRSLRDALTAFEEAQ